MRAPATFGGPSRALRSPCRARSHPAPAAHPGGFQLEGAELPGGIAPLPWGPGGRSPGCPWDGAQPPPYTGTLRGTVGAGWEPPGLRCVPPGWLRPRGAGLAAFLPQAGGVGWPCPHTGLPVPKLLFTPPARDFMSIHPPRAVWGSNPGSGLLALVLLGVGSQHPPAFGASHTTVPLPMCCGGNGQQIPEEFFVTAAFPHIFLPPARVTLAADALRTAKESIGRASLRRSSKNSSFPRFPSEACAVPSPQQLWAAACWSPPGGVWRPPRTTSTQGPACGVGDGSHGGADPLRQGGTVQAAAPASGLSSICF